MKCLLIQNTTVVKVSFGLTMSKTTLLIWCFLIVSHVGKGCPEIHRIVDSGSEHIVAWRETDRKLHSFCSWHGHCAQSKQSSETQLLQYRQSWDPNQPPNAEATQPPENLSGHPLCVRNRTEWQYQSHWNLHRGHISGSSRRKGEKWLGLQARVLGSDMTSCSNCNQYQGLECCQQMKETSGEVHWSGLSLWKQGKNNEKGHN